MQEFLRSRWLLDPNVTFLNHGSFGACPIAVLDQQSRWRQRLESEPVQFMVHDLPPALDQARATLATLVGSQPDHLVFVPNATTGVNSVLRSLRFSAGDELLTTNHVYNACRNILDFVAERWDATVVVAEVPFPLETSDQLVDALIRQSTSRTRIVLIDHVTSQTALVLPIEKIVRQFEAQDIPVLVDGAHAPGMLELALDNLGASFYTGNCHKWLCSPKGAGFLYVRPDWQEKIRPLTISHGANAPLQERSRWHLEFDWVGTIDPTAWLSVSTAIEYMGRLLPGGWPEVMMRNHELVVRGRQLLAEQLQTALPCPEEMLGSMATLPLPDGNAETLAQQLFQVHQVEVPIFAWPRSPSRWIRISAQLYNEMEDYYTLARALSACLDG